jgi:hypothetical protein
MSNFYSSNAGKFINKYDKTDNDKFNENQIKILENQQQQDIGIKSKYFENKKDTYDPYIEYLQKNDTISTNIQKKTTITYLHIDSSSRTIEPLISTTNMQQLSNNPLYFDQLSTSPCLLWIYYPNNNLVSGDRITITGIEKLNTTIKTQYTYTDIYGKTNSYKGVIFTEGNNYVKIMCPPNITLVSNYNSYVSINDAFTKLSNIYVTLNGFVGLNNSTFIGNIPINYLNGTHKIYLQQNTNEINDLTYFYIIIPYNYIGSENLANSNITITYNHYGGINLNLLNAEYPIDNNNINGYAEIYTTKGTDYISVIMNTQGLYSDAFGGDNIYISFIQNINTGYPNPNSYEINLKKTYRNISKITLLNTLFPNVSKIFRTTENITNTKLYWQNQSDGDVIYSIQIPDGNYDALSLKNTLESYIKLVKRISISNDNYINSYNDNNYITVDIDTNTDIVTFKSYSIASLLNPISSVLPEININDTISNTDTYKITIKHLNHGLSVGDTVLYTGMIDHLGIPSDSLNTTHVITEIVNVNYYSFVISHINLNTSKFITYGGYAVIAYVPNYFRLLFNYNDTMGNELGFRWVGSDLAVTNFNTIVKNSDIYFNEPNTNTAGNTITIKNKLLNFHGYDYVLMCCKEISDSSNINNFNTIVNHIGKTSIDNVFAKINLNKKRNKYVVDTFVSTPFYFNNSLEFSTLTFNFYAPDGTLYDFGGLNHSFVIELTIIDDLVENTEINSLKRLNL